MLHNGLLSPVYAALIVSLARGGDPLSKLLSHPALVLLGESSYATYILHVPIALWLSHLLDPVHHVVLLPLLFGITMLVLPVIVLLTFERPARTLIRSRLSALT